MYSPKRVLSILPGSIFVARRVIFMEIVSSLVRRYVAEGAFMYPLNDRRVVSSYEERKSPELRCSQEGKQIYPQRQSRANTSSYA